MTEQIERYPKSKRMLDCVLTEAELAEVGKALARTNQRKARLEAEKKSTVSHFKAEIDQCDAEIEQLSLKSTTGIESRMVDCELRYNDPEEGLKTTYRLDGKDSVKVHSEPMTMEERSDMFINMLGEQSDDDGGAVFVMRDKVELPIVDDNDDDADWEVITSGTAEEIVDQPLNPDLDYRVSRVEAGDYVEYALEYCERESE